VVAKWTFLDHIPDVKKMVASKNAPQRFGYGVVATL